MGTRLNMNEIIKNARHLDQN